jgi:hypothetical protein
MKEQQQWLADLGGEAPEYSPEQWSRARFLLGELIDLSANFGSDPLILLLHDSWVRAGQEASRART